MPHCVSNAKLDEMIEQTQVPEDAPLSAMLSVSAPVASNVNAALRELRRIRRELRTKKLIRNPLLMAQGR